MAGTRITVQAALEPIGQGLSHVEIIRDHYPDLTKQDILACIRYAIALIIGEDEVE